MKTTLMAAGLAFTAIFAAAPAFAEMQKFKGDLKAASEVPANDSKASGSVEATYDTVTKKLTYAVAYKDLSGPATAAHFHGPAAAGANAGVVVPWSSSMSSPMEGSATLTAGQVADLMAGRWYANVHTAAHPGGEVRGQMTVRN